MLIVGFCIDPPVIIPWISNEQKKKNVILLDFDVDIEYSGAYRIDLDVIFNPISIKRGNIPIVDYYIGSTGAEITLDLSDGLILNFTEATNLDDSYSNTKKKQRFVTLNLIPNLRTEMSSDETNKQVRSITRSASDESSLTVKFICAERYLAPVLMGNSIKWAITLPRGEKVIRDFLIGNLYLFATCTWKNTNKSGSINVRPSDIRFFDPDRRPLGTQASLLMKFILWQKQIQIENCNGFTINFEERIP